MRYLCSRLHRQCNCSCLAWPSRCLCSCWYRDYSGSGSCSAAWWCRRRTSSSPDKRRPDCRTGFVLRQTSDTLSFMTLKIFRIRRSNFWHGTLDISQILPAYLAVVSDRPCTAPELSRSSGRLLCDDDTSNQPAPYRWRRSPQTRPVWWVRVHPLPVPERSGRTAVRRSLDLKFVYWSLRVIQTCHSRAGY